MIDPDIHTIKLAQAFREAADIYLRESPDADINDVLTALAMMLVMHCIIHDVSRTDILRNVSTTYDNMSATRSSVGGLN